MSNILDLRDCYDTVLDTIRRTRRKSQQATFFDYEMVEQWRLYTRARTLKWLIAMSIWEVPVILATGSQ